MTPDIDQDSPAPASDQPAVETHLARTTRRVNTVTEDDRGSGAGRPVRLLVLTGTYDAAAEEVWAALTDPDRIGRWFLPVEGDLRPGGRFAIQGHASGEVLACDPGERVSLTWEHGEATSTVDLSLRPVAGGTVLQLDHRDPLDEQQWAEHGPGAVGIGWEQVMWSLATHLAGAAAGPPPDTLAAVVGPAADAWAEAAVADGDDPEQAAASARRCAAAYGA